MSLSQKEVILQIIDNAFAVALKETSESFSWELFWQFDVETKLHDYNLTLMSNAVNGQNCKNFNINNLIDIKSSDVADVIQNHKYALMSEHDIKLISFADYQNRVVDFFKEYRNIDFNSLNETERVSLLKNEDITRSENMIHKFLNMTHMQFKYFYQKGAVYLAL